MKYLAMTTLMVVTLAAGSGCAAVFKGSKQDVRFVALPAGTDVRIDNRYVGAAPVDTEVDRSHNQNVQFSKPGYRDGQIYLQKQNDTPWFAWDIATCVVPITLCIPLLVDAISGSWYSFDDEYQVKLEPLPAAAHAAAPPVIVPAPPPEPASAAGY